MSREFQYKVLEKALREVLVCPFCKNELVSENNFLRCKECSKKYPIIEGMPIFLECSGGEQEKERIFRDNLKYDSFLTNEERIIKEVGKHHVVSVMRQKANSFINNFLPSEWVADIGTGFSWHWKNNNPNSCFIAGVDFSITNLRVANRLLTDEDKVFLICADAACMPFKDNCISGLWSVQAFQHFPGAIFREAKDEANRILKDKFRMEIVNLNPATVLRIGSLLFGRKFARKKQMNGMDLNRLSSQELAEVWNSFRKNIFIEFDYSELFFYSPYFKISYYPALLDRVMFLFPQIAKHIARQIHMKVKSVDWEN
ncbi:MAG: methyltransferase domain-containing protein [Candidatus Omnitrophica bacterium]|nr:methyltransferase domain-containing protein [Candidatus Omnitrophota bacterium]